MQVTFDSTHYVSEDAHTVMLCHRGKTYDLAESAACRVINNGWAHEDKSYGQKLFEFVSESLNPITAQQVLDEIEKGMLREGFVKPGTSTERAT